MISGKFLEHIAICLEYSTSSQHFAATILWGPEILDIGMIPEFWSFNTTGKFGRLLHLPVVNVLDEQGTLVDQLRRYGAVFLAPGWDTKWFT